MIHEVEGIEEGEDDTRRTKNVGETWFEKGSGIKVAR